MSFLPFNANVVKNKPSTIANKNIKCPFCDRVALKKQQDFIKETSDFVITKNKFPVIENSFQTVIIEHQRCGEHIGTYSIEYLTNLLHFGLDYYNELLLSGEYKSVMFFKNHGLHSGGSIEHSHMQIIGLKDIDYNPNISPEDFIGETIYKDKDFDWNVSSRPRSEFYEINLIIKDQEESVSVLAKHLKVTVNYVLNTLNVKYQNYNLIFYKFKDKLIVKVICRGPVSALLLGFGLHQVPNNLRTVADSLRKEIN